MPAILTKQVEINCLHNWCFLYMYINRIDPNIGTKVPCAKSVDPDQTAHQEQSDQGPHFLTFRK